MHVVTIDGDLLVTLNRREIRVIYPRADLAEGAKDFLERKHREFYRQRGQNDVPFEAYGEYGGQFARFLNKFVAIVDGVGLKVEDVVTEVKV